MVSPSCSARSRSSFVQQYIVLSSEKEIPASLLMQPVVDVQVGNTSLQGYRHEHSGSNTLFPK